MSRDVLNRALDFMVACAQRDGQDKVNVLFHGGEPLLAGSDFWHTAIDGLLARFGYQGLDASVQSNLWLLDDEMCAHFVRGRIDIGTSLDGPREINDAQRGAGHFCRTMAGIRRAQKHGLNVACIATFTPQNASRWREVLQFFVDEGLNISIHASVPPLSRPKSDYALSPKQYAELLCEMLDYYIEHRRDLVVSSLDQVVRSVVSGRGHVCSFRSCLGMFLAIDPKGDIFPCQRFVGAKRHRIGTVSDEPNPAAIFAGRRVQWMANRQRRTDEACAACPHFDYCRGGCAYNAIAANTKDGRDPYCDAYRVVFERVRTRLSEELGSEENLVALTADPRHDLAHPLLRKGPLIELVRKGPHPSSLAQTAKRIVAAVELARGPDISAAGHRLVHMGICRSPQSAQRSLEALQEFLKLDGLGRNNLYLHVAFRCQLVCRHCYARARKVDSASVVDLSGQEMSPDALGALICEAKKAGFRQVVVTGGEPLMHHRRSDILTVLEDARKWTFPMNLVLRTNLAMPLTDDELNRIAKATDQLVVSVDGDESFHDARRGKGSYQAVTANLKRYAELASATASASKLSLAAVLSNEQIQGMPGHAVRKLGEKLGVRRIRFRPVLPIGRAKDWDQLPASEAIGGYADPMSLIEAGFLPVASCGIGQNLYVEPSGESFPCYAFHQPHTFLGNVLAVGLAAVLASNAFAALSRHGVDTNSGCRTCDMRYLCGGACRAWTVNSSEDDLDAAPSDCADLRKRASRLYEAACEWLAIRPIIDSEMDDCQ